MSTHQCANDWISSAGSEDEQKITLTGGCNKSEMGCVQKSNASKLHRTNYNFDYNQNDVERRRGISLFSLVRLVDEVSNAANERQRPKVNDLFISVTSCLKI